MSQELTQTMISGGCSNPTGGKFLTFYLAQEEYGLEILKVREIIGLLPVTPIPRSPDYVRGIINLRGKIIPVVDLRLKFGMKAIKPSDETCIIVVRACDVETGILVDKVSEVQDVTEDEIESTPSLGSDTRTDYILGVGKSQGKVELLLDIEKALSNLNVITN